MGVHNISKDFTEIKRIKRIITHENYNIIDKNNDIALLEMESPIFYGPKTQPICLPDGSEFFLIYNKIWFTYYIALFHLIF